MKFDPEIINKQIHFLAKRPGMYVSEITFDKVATYIDGYFMGVMDATDSKVFSSWRYWIAMKYGVWGPAWSWSNTIRHHTNSDEEAIKMLPGLFSEFIKTYKNEGEERIEQNHRNFDYGNYT